MPQLTCILLAAGLSQRMGTTNKLLLPYQDQTILTTTLQQLHQSIIDHIIVVTGFEDTKIKRVLQTFPNLQVIHNPEYQEGMTSSIQSGLEALQAPETAIMIALGDMPLLRAADYNRLIQHFKRICEKEETPIVRPIYQKQIGHPVIFHEKYIEALKRQKGKQGCRAIIKAHPTDFRGMQTEHLAYVRDIDTPDDYQQWKQ